MNINKNDLFYVFMSFIVASIGVVAVSNANTKIGLYGLLGLVAIAVIMAIIIKPSLGANILVLAIYSNISDLLTKQGDRKSTRLNSSHMSISYAVFCLKKKKKKNNKIMSTTHN